MILAIHDHKNMVPRPPFHSPRMRWLVRANQHPHSLQSFDLITISCVMVATVAIVMEQDNLTTTPAAVLLFLFVFFPHPPLLSFAPSLAWSRVTIQACLPEGGEREGQEGPGEVVGATGPAHLFPLSPGPPH